MRWLLGLLPFFVVACGEARSSDAARAERKTAREAAAEVHMRQPAQVRTHQVDGGQLLVVDVPVSDGFSNDVQRCFVYRDDRVASLSCPSRDVVLSRD